MRTKVHTFINRADDAYCARLRMSRKNGASVIEVCFDWSALGAYDSLALLEDNSSAMGAH